LQAPFCNLFFCVSRRYFLIELKKNIKKIIMKNSQKFAYVSVTKTEIDGWKKDCDSKSHTCGPKPNKL